MNNKNLITKNQIDFKEKSRTADHIFTLKTIIVLRTFPCFTPRSDEKEALSPLENFILHMVSIYIE
jgi:hypothetical protein